MANLSSPTFHRFVPPRLSRQWKPPLRSCILHPAAPPLDKGIRHEPQRAGQLKDGSWDGDSHRGRQERRTGRLHEPPQRLRTDTEAELGSRRLGFRRSFTGETLCIYFLRSRRFYTLQEGKTPTFSLTRSHNYRLLTPGELKRRQVQSCACWRIPSPCQVERELVAWLPARCRDESPDADRSEQRQVICGGLTCFSC